MKVTAEQLQQRGWKNTAFKVDHKEVWSKDGKTLLFDRANGTTSDPKWSKI